MDAALTRSLRQLFGVGLFDQPSAAGTDWTQTVTKEDINSAEHRRVRDDAALQAIVLLQNDPVATLGGAAQAAGGSGDGAAPLLPLAGGAHRIAVVGPQSDARTGLLSDYASEEPCFGGGDACIVSITDALRTGNTDGQGGPPKAVTQAQGVSVSGLERGGIAAALDVARAADVVVLALGIDKSVEGEGTDRPEITLPGLQSEFAEKVLALGKPTVLVLTNGGALAIDALASHTRFAGSDGAGAAGAGAGQGQENQKQNHEEKAKAPGPAAIIEAFNPCTDGATALGQVRVARPSIEHSLHTATAPGASHSPLPTTAH